MADKDRRSRMAYSTVNAQPVKAGVGLGYVDANYGTPIGGVAQVLQVAPAQTSSVVYAAAPQMMPTASDRLSVFVYLCSHIWKPIYLSNKIQL